MEAPSDAELCPDCELSLLVPCPQCRTSNSAGNRFCKKCGHAMGSARSSAESDRFAAPNAYTPQHLAEKILTSRAALQGERKLVTVLFVDVSGFTALSEKLDPEDVHALMDRAFELIPPVSLRNFFKLDDPGRDVRPLLPALRIPTLVLHGGHDRNTPVEAARWTAEQITGARFHALEGRSHMMVATAPAEFAEVVRRFIHTGPPT